MRMSISSTNPPHSRETWHLYRTHDNYSIARVPWIDDNSIVTEDIVAVNSSTGNRRHRQWRARFKFDQLSLSSKKNTEAKKRFDSISGEKRKRRKEKRRKKTICFVGFSLVLAFNVYFPNEFTTFENVLAFVIFAIVDEQLWNRSGRMYERFYCRMNFIYILLAKLERCN